MQKILKPNSDSQVLFLTSEADIVLYGGAAGGGKTYAMLLYFLERHQIRDYTAVVVRRSLKEIEQGGGLFDEITSMVTGFPGVKISKANLTISFPAFGSKLIFKRLRPTAHDEWQGGQYDYIGMDEFTHYDKKDFLWVITRGRSVKGGSTKIKATCNPNSGSWVRDFIDWWIDEDGYAIEERKGVIRWFVNENDRVRWFNTKEEAYKKIKGPCQPMSFTYINSKLEENITLMQNDPSYIAKLSNAGYVTKKRLLEGNWNVADGGGQYFNRDKLKIVQKMPTNIVAQVRAWDLAATIPSSKNRNPNYTAGVLMAKTADNKLYVLDVIRFRKKLDQVTKMIIAYAKIDSPGTIIRLTKEGGATGQYPEMIAKELMGYPVDLQSSRLNKEARAEIASAQFGAENIYIMKGPWNEFYIEELHAFPEGPYDDCVDATVDCINSLGKRRKPVRSFDTDEFFSKLYN